MPVSPKVLTAVRFEGFELDVRAGELRRPDGGKTRLGEQPFRILIVLLENPGGVVLRETIRKKLWPNDTIVEFEHSIGAAMNRLRQALGDSADKPKYIETLARRGYRWMTEVERVEGIPAVEMDGSAEQKKEMEAASGDLIGRTVSHYKVLELLGSGGMGIVYKAEDVKLSRPVALKFLPEGMASDPRALERFQREALAISGLDHPNICTIYEVEEHVGQPFLVMQLLEGQTLRERIESHTGQRACFRNEELLDISLQIASGLEAAHQKGLIHRDIKPANIFLTNRGEAKILDFGLAKLVESAEPHETLSPQNMPDGAALPESPMRSTVTLSLTGLALGTPAYLSPEQVSGEKLDARTDVYSFGLVLYEMATGIRAIAGNTAPEIHEAILDHPPRAVRELNPEVSRGLEQIVHRAINKDREARYRDASEMREDLLRLKRGASASRRPWEIGLAAALVLLSVAGAIFWAARRSNRVEPLAVGGWLFFSRKAHALTDKDTLVLADFTNTTGDAVFDGTLRRGLSVQLEQSPFLSIISDQQIQRTLQMMGLKPDAKLTPEIARELCQRTGSAAVLDGSIAQIGSRYSLILKAVNCSNEESLTSTEAEASDKSHVLDALGKAASEIRNKLGESLSTVQKFDTPLEQATTSSLEALQAYSVGVRIIQRGDDDAAAIAFFQQAINLDPNFAMAHAMLFGPHAEQRETNMAFDHIQKAFELRDRVSQREKFSIESLYHTVATGDLEKEKETVEVWARMFPRDPIPRSRLGILYGTLGQYDKGLSEMREALRLLPDSGLEYCNVIYAYLPLNRFEDARAAAKEAEAKNLDLRCLHNTLYVLAFLENDSAGMVQQIAWGAGKPEVEDELQAFEARTAAYFGRLRRAREISGHKSASVEGAKEKQTAAARSEPRTALRAALFGNTAEARQHVASFLGISKDNKEAQYAAALTLALTGDTSRAQALADDLGKRYPKDTIVQFNYLPTLHAQIALSRNDVSKAIEVLQAAASYELGDVGFTNLYPVFVRGEAYLAAQQGGEAAGEFRKILDHRGIVLNESIGALAHLQIGRAYAMQGDTVKAKAAYQDFLTLWKDADPDIPILTAAKAEYAKLH